MFPPRSTYTTPWLALVCALVALPAAADNAAQPATTETADGPLPLLEWIRSAAAEKDWHGSPAGRALGKLVEGTRFAASLSSPSGIVEALSDSTTSLERRPVRGEITSPFGVRRDPIRRRRRRHHNGLDFEAARGTLVRAAGPGTIVSARRAGGYGRVVYIDHGDGLETRYAHLQKIKVREGDYVAAGGIIGTVGSSGRATGPHLHFEVRVDGRPVEPSEFLGVDREVKELRRDRPAL